MPATTPYVVSIAIDAVIDALAGFLGPFVSPSEIIRAQVNRVSPPLGPFVELTEISITDLETPTRVLDPANNQAIITGPAQIDIQVDFYGPTAGDQCKAVETVYRSPYSPAQFPDGIKPLFCSSGTQSALITGEEQYESRWIITASLQYNPSVAVPLQSANTLTVSVFEDLP